ncbi:phosphatase PAP2 family protein [Candidatus Fermentibacteria bacterium]|nr:phosphatase PAP2 family protein [Candidatus Fermentibacteria bacterium]
MTSPSRDEVAFPAEGVLGAYLALAGASAILIRPPSWATLAGGMLVAAAMFFFVRRLPRPSSPRATGLRAVAPLACFPVLYPLTGMISRGLPVWLLDGPLKRWEEAAFGGQPAMFLAEAAPWKALSEVLHACYFSFYFLVIGLPVVLAFEGRAQRAARVMRNLCTCFGVCLLCYIWIPATSPLYASPPLPEALRDGFFYRLTHAVADRGGVRGGAFPSSHAALAVCNLVMAFRDERRVFWLTLAPTMGLLVATVYGRYHFALDTVAGTLVGLAFAGWGLCRHEDRGNP